MSSARNQATRALLPQSLLLLAGVCAFLTPTRAHAACREARIPSCDDQVTRAVPPGTLDGVSLLRRSIIEAAAAEIGITSALPGRDCHKRGWQHLQEYFELATEQPLRSSQLKILKRAKTEPGPAENYIFQDWCGIFALWAVKTGAQHSLLPCPPSTASQDVDTCSTASEDTLSLEERAHATKLVAAQWTMGTGGGTITGLTFHTGTRGLQPGDVAVFKDPPDAKPLNHHALVERIRGDQIYTIDGNTDCQMVLRKTRSVSSVAGYWSLE